jgi:hypothetical protein
VLDCLRPSINSHSRRDLPLTVYSRMEMAKWKDSVQRDQPYYIVEPTITINFVLLQSPLPAPHDPEPVIVSRERRFIRALSSIVILFTRQRSLMLVHLFQRFFGTLAATRVVHISTSSKTLTSICLSLQTRAHIRLNFSSTHFKIQAKDSSTTTLSMSSLIGPAVCFLKSNTNLGSLATCGR